MCPRFLVNLKFSQQQNKSGKNRVFWEREIAKGLVVSSLAIFVVVPLGLNA